METADVGHGDVSAEFAVERPRRVFAAGYARVRSMDERHAVSVVLLSYELVGDGRIHQFCIRSGDREEFRFADEHTDMHKFDFDGLTELIEELKSDNLPVYFTIDLDCLDPSVFCGTGTPEAGGVNFKELLNAILEVSKTNIVGADLNELAPMLDISGASTAVACKVLRELILSINT